MQILNVAPEGFTFGRASNGKSGYAPLYAKLKQMKVGEYLVVNKNLGYDEGRTAKHNKTNIMSCIGKQLDLQEYKFNCGLPPNLDTPQICLQCISVPEIIVPVEQPEDQA